MTHQPAISFSNSFRFPFNRAGGRTSNVRQNIKTFIALILVAASQFASAIPHQPFKVEEITGTVDFAVCRSPIVLNRVFATLPGKKQNEQSDALPAHWILLLRDVAGLSREQRDQISWAFAGGELPIDWSRKRFLDVQKQNYLYVRVDGASDWPIKIGSKVRLRKVNYAGSDFSGWITLESFEVEGKAMNLPATRQNGHSKGEQGGGGQPATRSESK